MSFLRSLSVFILSLIFTSFIFIAITSNTLGTLIQKESIKVFLGTEGKKFISLQCEEDCKQYSGDQAECLQSCEADITNQTSVVVDKATDEIYQRNFFGFNLNETSSAASDYFAFLIIGIISGVLLMVASKTPLSTLGKNLISIAISLFILVLVMHSIMVYVNLPLNLGKDFLNYLSPGFDQQIKYGIILLVVGIVLIVINYDINRRKNKINKEPNKSKK